MTLSCTPDRQEERWQWTRTGSTSSSAGSSATSAPRSLPAASSSATGSGSTARSPTGPATADELAARTGTHPRYVAEWLRGQAAGGYVEYDAATGTFSLTEEQAFALTDPDGPVYLPGAFVLALGTLRAESQITDAFRTGAGMGWHEHHDDVPLGCEMFFRPGYLANLVPELDPGAGRRRGEAGRGRPRWPTWAAGSAPRPCCWPRPTRARPFVGSDYHERVDRAGPQARRRGGVEDRASFEVATAQDFPGTGLRPGGDLRLPARHGRPGRPPPGTCARRSPPTAPG